MNLPKMVARDMKEAIIYVSKIDRTIGRIMLILLFTGMTLGPITSVALPVLVMMFFDAGESTLGIMQAIVIFGGTVGVLLLNKIEDKVSIYSLRKMLGLCAVTIVPLVVVLFFSQTYLLSMIVVIATFFVIIGVFSVLGIVVWTYLGENVPGELIGKVLALVTAITALGMAIGDFWIGEIFDWFIDTPGFAILIMMIAIGIVSAFAKVRVTSSIEEAEVQE